MLEEPNQAAVYSTASTKHHHKPKQINRRYKHSKVELANEVIFTVQTTTRLTNQSRCIPLSRVTRTRSLPTSCIESTLSSLHQSKVIQAHHNQINKCQLTQPTRRVALTSVVQTISNPLAIIRNRHPSGVRCTNTTTKLRSI